MAKHIANANFNGSFPCNKCKSKLDSYGKLEEHREYHHGSNIEKLLEPKKCPTCQQSFAEDNCPNCNL